MTSPAPTTVLVARLDSDGDVLLAGPAVRAVAAGADRVVLLCGPRGEAAARLLPGVNDVLVWHCPWIDPQPAPVDSADMDRLIEAVRTRNVARALVLTSYHQSPLPLALLLRLAGVGWIGAVSEDYPGSLLDLRHRLPETGLHEVQRMLSLAAAAGFDLPADDDGALAVRRPLPDVSTLSTDPSYVDVPYVVAPYVDAPYVVVHPGASVPARAWAPARNAALVSALANRGTAVVVTGGPGERALTASVAGPPRAGVRDLGGMTDLAGLAAVLAGAEAVVVGNTGPAHLAAAVGTPVVSLFAPTVPAQRWAPWSVPTVVLGDQAAPCALSRATVCPVPGHPCLDEVSVPDVVAALDGLVSARRSRLDNSGADGRLPTGRATCHPVTREAQEVSR